MKLSDLFLPKIARSNPEVRLKAVQKTSDPKLLENVIKNDASDEVRQAASQRLKELQPTA